MRHFILSMERVSQVDENISQAKDLRDYIQEKAFEKTNKNGGLDYSATIEIPVSDAMDVVHALDLLCDRLLSMELKQHS